MPNSRETIRRYNSLLCDIIIGKEFASPPVGSTSTLPLLNVKLLFPLSCIGYPREAKLIAIPGRGML